MDYNSEYTGEQVDEAVGKVLDNAEDWDEAAQEVGELTDRVSSVEEAVQNIPTGSIDETVYAAIKANVNTLRQRLNDLINALANLAFSTGRVSTLPAFTWPESGGPTPESPSLAFLVNGVAVSSLSFSNTNESKSVTIKGTNIKKALMVSISGNFTISSNSNIMAAQANNGVTREITYTGNSPAIESGTLVISSDEVSEMLSLSGQAANVPSSDYSVNVNPTLSHCQINGTLPSASSNGSVSIDIVAESGYTLSGVEPSIAATVGTPSYSYNANTRKLTIIVSNITANTTIILSVEARELQVASFLDGKYLSSSIGGMSNLSGAYCNDSTSFFEIPSNVKALFWNHGFTDSTARYIVFYDANKEYKANKTSKSDNSSDKGWRKFIVPTGAVFARASFNSDIADRFLLATTQTAASDSAAQAISDSNYNVVIFDGSDTESYTIS